MDDLKAPSTDKPKLIWDESGLKDENGKPITSIHKLIESNIEIKKPNTKPEPSQTTKPKPMTAKEELTQIRHIDQEITFMLEQLEELETSLTRISPVLSDMPTCHDNNRDKIADGIVRIIEMKTNINKRIDYLYDYKIKMTDIINKIENPVFRRILAIRYFKKEHNSFEEISTAIGYSYYPTIHMHGIALQEFTRIQSEQDIAT